MTNYVTLPQNIIEVCILSQKAGFLYMANHLDHFYEPKINMDVENWMEVM